jgi:hypothetical protein
MGLTSVPTSRSSRPRRAIRRPTRGGRTKHAAGRCSKSRGVVTRGSAAYGRARAVHGLVDMGPPEGHRRRPVRRIGCPASSSSANWRAPGAAGASGQAEPGGREMAGSRAPRRVADRIGPPGGAGAADAEAGRAPVAADPRGPRRGAVLRIDRPGPYGRLLAGLIRVQAMVAV